MEPLSITCDTCQARLKVRDPAAIGQILMCPKCQSMVLVKAPEGWSPPADDAPSADAPDAAESAPTEIAAPPLSDTGAEKESATSFEDDAVFEEPPLPSSSDVSKPSRKKVATAAAATTPVPPAVDELPDLAMPATSPWSQIMATSAGRWSVIAAGSLAVILVGVIAWSVIGGDEDEAGEDVAAQQDTAEKNQPPEEKAPEETTATKPVDDNEQKKPVLEEPNPFAPEKPTPPKDKPDPADIKDDNPFDNGPADERPEEPAPDKPIEGEPPVDPKDEVPEEPATDESSEDLLAGMDLLDEGELFGLGSGFSIRGEAEPGEKEPAPDDPGKKPGKAPAEQDAPEPNAGRQELAAIDIEAALKQRVLGVQYNGIRMTDFVENIADISRLPITLDLDALEPLKVKPSSELVVKMGETTVGDLLSRALKGHDKRLTLHRDEHGVTIAPASRNRSIPMGHDATDLAKEPEDRKELIDVIQRFVLPGTWEGQGGSGTIQDVNGKLQVKHSMQAQYQMIVLLEKLRTAASKPPKNKFYDVRTFDLRNRQQRATKQLAKIVKANHVLKQPLASMVRQLERTTGTNIAVDWAALREENIGRDTPVRLIIDARSLSQAMDDFVEPLRLAWRVHDATTLQMTTKSKVEGQLDMEVYGLQNVLAAGLAADDLLKQLRRDTDPKAWESHGGRGQLHVDSHRGCLLVLANQATQNTIGQILAKLREQNLAGRSR